MGKGTIKTKAMTMAVAMSMVAGLCPSTVFAANSEDVAKVQDGTYTGIAECTPDEYEEFPAIAVAAHHIDTNHHVNNAQYVEIAREVLPAGLFIRELRVEYKKAAILGDQIIPRVSAEADCYTVALCDTEGRPYAVVWLRTGR